MFQIGKGRPTSEAQDPSPGLNWLMVPVQLAHVKSSIFTVALFGRPVVAPFPFCVWVLPWL